MPDTRIDVAVLEGTTVLPTPTSSGAAPGAPAMAVLEGLDGIIRFDEPLLSKHVLFLGSIGSGKTNAMMQVVTDLRHNAGPDDVFVIFDTKGDYHAELYQDEDAVGSANERRPGPGGRFWNIFRDLLAADIEERVTKIFEIATTIFAEQLDSAGENLYFAAACGYFYCLC